MTKQLPTPAATRSEPNVTRPARRKAGRVGERRPTRKSPRPAPSITEAPKRKRRAFPVPENLDIASLLVAAGRGGEVELRIDRYHYVLERLSTGARGYQKKQPYSSGAGFVNLSLKILRQILGSNHADTILKDLIAWGVIETDGRRIVGKKSYGYRLTAPYAQKHKLRPVANQAFAKKLQARKEGQAQLKGGAAILQENQSHLAISPQAAPDLERRRDKIAALLESAQKQEALRGLPDSSGLSLYTSLYHSLSASPTTSPLLSSLIVPTDMERALEAQEGQRVKLNAWELARRAMENGYAGDLATINCIDSGDLYCIRPDEASRVYNAMSSMSKRVRGYIYHADAPNEPLAVLDICNSQPWIFCALLRKFYQGSPLPADVSEYIRLTSQGKLYDYLMQEAGISNDSAARNAFKGDFFGTVFFCKTSHARRTPHGKLFARLFPNVARAIEHEKGEDTKTLPIAMQREEARVMIDRIVCEIDARNIFCLSIHDSIVCLQGDRAEVERIMLAAFQREWGSVPTLKYEELAPVAC